MSLTTLSEAQDWLRQRVTEGATCPCCQQYAKVYRRKLTSASARAVIALYQEGHHDWGHLPTIVKRRIPDVAHQGGYMNLAVHWGLIEEEKTIRPDGGRAGWWRVTTRGRQWLYEHETVPKYAMLYDGRCLRLDGEPVSVRDTLGSKFDYDELMKGI